MIDIDKLNPKFLNHRRGFRSIKPDAMTGAERLRKMRAERGGRFAGSFCLRPDAAAACLYLQKQWGMTTMAEAVEVALLHLAAQTRMGLEKIEIGFAVDEDDTQC